MEKLPPELIVEILNCLTWNELKIARLVCHEWYDFSHELFPKKCGIKPKYVDQITGGEFQNWIISKNIEFHTVTLTYQCLKETVADDKFEQFLSVFNSKTQRIRLLSGYLPVNRFTRIIERCTGLSSLEISTAMDGNVFTDPENLQQLCDINLLKLKRFSFEAADIGYCNLNVFQLLTNSMPNVKHVKIFVKSDSEDFSLECQSVVHEFIKRQAVKLKSLILLGWEVPALYNFLMVPNLRLVDLTMEIYSTASLENVRKMNEVFVKQSQLKHLTLIKWQMDVGMVETICRNFKDLKTFALERCVMEPGWLKHISGFNNLQILHLLFCSSTTFDEIAVAFLSKENLNMNSLELRGNLGDHKLLFSMLQNVKNLKCLNFESHDERYGINDDDFRNVIFCLKKLTFLKIYPYELLTDAAILNIDNEKCLSSLKHLHHFEIPLATKGVFEFSNAAVYELLEIRNLKVVKLPESDLISEQCQNLLGSSFSYTRFRKPKGFRIRELD